MKKIFVLFLMFISSISIFAQEDETWRCATDEVYRDLIKNNPEILIERQKLDEFVQDYIKNNPKDDEIYVIPVVFHVVHDYGVENISYEQILSAVDFMNTDYRLQRSDTNTIHPAFKSIAADTHIEFRLAKIDPNGECTIGITRTVSETTYGGGEEAKEAAPSWPSDKYLNIWTVYSLGGGAAGWSYYPGTAPYGRDGIILLHDYVGVTGTSTSGHGSVLTHEAGHYLNLPHPWGSTNDPEVPSNCDIDDGIEDTPNTIGHTSCNLYAVTCGSLDNVQNFMDYSYCYKMFTQGQSNVMRATLNSSVSGRNNLHSIENLIATGTNDGYEAQVCAPIADFKANKNLGCTGFTVHYNNLSYNTDFIGYSNWTFDGGDPSSSDEFSPAVVYNQKGLFDAQLYVENPTDFDSKLIADYIRVYDAEDGISLPYSESFETSDFPFITGNTDNDFYLAKEGERNWEQTDEGYNGKSIKIVNKYNNIGTKNKIYLPNIFINDDTQTIQVTMKIAYGRIESNYADRLKFYVSNSCGDSLRIVYVLSASSITSRYVTSYSTYVPTAEDWKTHTFTINPSSLRGNNLRFVIEAESGGGSAIYIDDVSFEIVSTDNIEASLQNKISVYPNPCVDELFIQNSNSGQELYMTITDYTGKVLATDISSDYLIKADNLISNLPAGIYFLKIEGKNHNKVYKLIKT
ncbi:MAG: M43 family zinc metalloprotease [Bacteroidales bacterium]|nr:M43 family zinc metalloprotease [Bacteroidales bacterium]